MICLIIFLVSWFGFCALLFYGMFFTKEERKFWAIDKKQYKEILSPREQFEKDGNFYSFKE